MLEWPQRFGVRVSFLSFEVRTSPCIDGPVLTRIERLGGVS